MRLVYAMLLLSGLVQAESYLDGPVSVDGGVVLGHELPDGGAEASLDVYGPIRGHRHGPNTIGTTTAAEIYFSTFVCLDQTAVSSPCLNSPYNGMELFARWPDRMSTGRSASGFIFSERAQDDGGERGAGYSYAFLRHETPIANVTWHGGLLLGDGNPVEVEFLGANGGLHSSAGYLKIHANAEPGTSAFYFYNDNAVAATDDIATFSSGGAIAQVLNVTNQGGIRYRPVTRAARVACNSSGLGIQISCSDCGSDGGVALTYCDGATWLLVTP